MFGKKQQRVRKEACPSCDGPLDDGQKVCECGKATRFMDFTERTKYEVEQWRAYQERTAANA